MATKIYTRFLRALCSKIRNVKRMTLHGIIKQQRGSPFTFYVGKLYFAEDYIQHQNPQNSDNRNKEKETEREREHERLIERESDSRYFIQP